MLEDTSAVNSEEQLLDMERKQLLAVAIKRLDQREQQILNMLYVDELSLKEIAYVYDLSVPRISQIHGKMIVKLKGYMKEAYND
ncbi:Sigma-28 [Mycobacteroides abscessus subsp. abscessus]|nr:Sigma-28 [Mycobacteroides abscessus subsp. abscessus]